MNTEEIIDQKIQALSAYYEADVEDIAIERDEFSEYSYGGSQYEFTINNDGDIERFLVLLPEQVKDECINVLIHDLGHLPFDMIIPYIKGANEDIECGFLEVKQFKYALEIMRNLIDKPARWHNGYEEAAIKQALSYIVIKLIDDNLWQQFLDDTINKIGVATILSPDYKEEHEQDGFIIYPLDLLYN